MLSASHLLLAKDTSAILPIKNNPIRVSCVKAKCLLSPNTLRSICEEFMPRLSPIVGSIMRSVLCKDIGSLRIKRMHVQIPRIIEWYVLDYRPGFACIVTPVDNILLIVLEQDDIGVVEIFYIHGVVVKLRGFDGRTIFLRRCAGNQKSS